MRASALPSDIFRDARLAAVRVAVAFATTITLMATSAAVLAAADEVCVALSQADTFGFRDGVWHAINAPQSMIEHDAQATIAGRLRLGKDELARVLASVGLGSAKAASWLKKLQSVRPTDQPRLMLETVSGDMRYRDERYKIAWVRFTTVCAPMSAVEPRSQIALGSTDRQPLPIWKTHEQLDRLRSEEAVRAAAAAAAAETARRARERAEQEELEREAAFNKKRSLRGRSPDRGGGSSSVFQWSGSVFETAAGAAAFHRGASPTRVARAAARPRPTPTPSPQPQLKPSPKPSAQATTVRPHRESRTRSRLLHARELTVNCRDRAAPRSTSPCT